MSYTSTSPRSLASHKFGLLLLTLIPQIRIQTMIAYPPHQQVHIYHLALSLVILFLTIYPVLFRDSGTCGLVAAYSSDDFALKHELIDRFDILELANIVVSKSISTRSIDEIDANFTSEQDTVGPGLPTADAKRRVQFRSLGRRFDLVLRPTLNLITDDFTITVIDEDGKSKVVPFNISDMEIFEGNVHGEKDSKATASISKHNKLVTAHIASDQEIYIMEPAYLHRNYLKRSLSGIDFATPRNFKQFEKTMIFYKLSDHEQFRSQDDPLLESKQFCAATSIFNNSVSTIDYSQDHNSSSGSIDSLTKYPDQQKLKFNRTISKRGIDFFQDERHEIKDRTRCTLHLVADYLFYKHVGNKNYQTTVNYLLALINRVNQIYLPTKWETGDDRVGTFNNIGFTVQNMTIHEAFTKLSTDDSHYNMENRTTWGAREFLDNFSRYSPPKHYCLAHLLTYRLFDSPVLGLAYVASTRHGQIGGICSPIQTRGGILYKHNTGVSTSMGINGETLITRQADLVLAHELGHNLGAEHDSDECRPSPSQGGAYLMHPYSVMGFEKNNRFLSTCSRIAIGRVIKRKAPTCFVGIVDNVCGNGVREKDEECDGGAVGHGHSDPCCDSSCRFTPGSQCSDRNSFCCINCRIVPAGRPCRSAEEFNCKQAIHCNGVSAECPSDAPPIEDGRACVGRGQCRSGRCDQFCEFRGLQSCLCNNPKDACKLCCKQSINSTCVPYDERAPYLPDGVLCYRGVCEKGRCEQPIQDLVERLWDVIEDINLSNTLKFFRDNIILVVLLISIPAWCLFVHFINRFDERIRQDVISTIIKYRKRANPTIAQSPFLPRLFVGDENNSANSLDDYQGEASLPLKQAYNLPSSVTREQQYTDRPPIGFFLPAGEEVVIEPHNSIVLNSNVRPE